MPGISCPAATVDLSATGGGVTQVASGTITATTSLTSSTGVKGTVDLAGTKNSIAALGPFAVNTGNFTLVDTGKLTVRGQADGEQYIAEQRHDRRHRQSWRDHRPGPGRG